MKTQSSSQFLDGSADSDCIQRLILTARLIQSAHVLLQLMHTLR